MENKRQFRGRTALIVGGVLLMLAGGVRVGYYFYVHRDELPDLPFQDLNGERLAGRADRVLGKVAQRPSEITDFPAPPPGAAITPGPLVTMSEGNQYYLGTLFQVDAKSGLQSTTVGNWVISLEGDGEFIFEDARTNSAHSVHTGFWFIKKGTFRAKPHDYDKGDHMLRIRTARATLYLRKAEVGMRVSEGGGGSVWAVSGKVVVIWNDGKRKELGLMGLDNL